MAKRIGKNRGIQSQFWNLKEREFSEFKLKIKVVKKLPSKIHKHAKGLICWGFMAEPDRATLQGFPYPESGGLIEATINQAYATINEIGVMQKFLVHNYNQAFKLDLELSSTRLSFLFDMLKYDAHPFYDSNELIDLVYDRAIKQGLIKPENEESDKKEKQSDGS